MFTSSRLAPPRTWSSATSSAPCQSSASMSRRKTDRAGDVGALPDDDEGGVLVDDERLEPAEARTRGTRRDRTRSQAVHGGRDPRDVLGSRAAAATHAVDEPVLGKRAQRPRRLLRGLVVAAERVRQAGVRVAEHGDGRDTGEVGEEGAHLRRAERAVDPHGERLGVLDRDPEGVHRLAREGATAAIDDGHGDDERDLVAALVLEILDRRDRRLGVQRVEDRLDQQEIGAAVEQSARDLRVSVAHLVERGDAIRRVVDAWRERQGDARRPERAGDDPGAVSVHRAPRDLGPGPTELVHVILEPVLALRGRMRGEGVGRDQIRARLEVGAVDGLDVRRPREAEHVDVAPQVLRVAAAEARAAHVLLREAERLHLRAHGAVEHHDAFREKCCQSFGRAHRPLLRRPGDHAYERSRPAGAGAL